MEDLFSRSAVVVHILFLILPLGYAEVTNFGLCKDPDCSDPVALGATTLRYRTAEEDKISFGVGLKVKIFSRDAGPKNDLLGVEIEGKRGYVPKIMVRETMVYAQSKTLVPAKSKFDALSSSPGNTEGKPAEKVTHSHSASDPESSSTPLSDEPVLSSSLPTDRVPSSSPDEDVTSSMHSSNESASSVTSMPEEQVNQNNEKASDAETEVHSETESGKILVTQSENEPEDRKSHPSETSDIDNDKSDESHSSEAASADIINSDVVPSDTFTVSTDSITHSSQQDGFRTSSETTHTGGTRGVQHSGDKLEISDHLVDSTLPTTDTVSDIHPTGAETVDSYSTEHFEYIHSDSAAVTSDSHSLTSNNHVSIEPILPSHAEDKEHETVSENLSSAHAQITESLPRAVEAIVESFSSGSLKPDKDTVQKVTQPPLQKTQEQESVDLSAEIDATLAMLAEQGYNVSDVSADNELDSPSYNTYAESRNVNDFRAQSSHNLPRKPPLVDTLQGGLRSLDKTIKKHSKENEILSDAVQHHSPKENVNSKSTSIFSEDSMNMKPQGSVLTKTDDDTALPSETHSQHSHASGKYQNASGDDSVMNSQESRSHTSFNDMNYEKDYASVTNQPVPNHQPKKSGTVPATGNDPDIGSDHSSMSSSVHDSIDHVLGVPDKNEGNHVHLTSTEDVNIQSSGSVTEDHSEATVQSEPNVNAKSLDDYSSSVTETTFVSRHLKSEMESDDLGQDNQFEEQDVSSDSTSSSSFSLSETFSNSVEGLRSFIEVVILWLPEPLQLYLHELQTKGVPPRATVFTALIAMPTIFLIISIIYIRQSSKEKSLLVKLSGAEQKLFLAATERDVLKEDIGKLKTELNTLQSDLEQEQKSAYIFKKKMEKSENLSQSSSIELRTQLKDLENQVEMKTASLSALQTALEQCKETNSLLQRKLQEEENAVSTISVQLQEFEEEVRTLQKEKEDFIQSETNYKGKIVELEQSCNQLLEEAEVWNSRVNELTQQLQNETSCHEELEKNVQSKDSEIQSLQSALMDLEVIQELKNAGDADENTFEERMKQMLDTSAVQIKLKKAEDERITILKSFESERDRVMELEVEMMEAKSEIEKLKSNYNQALQDKTEAQTKLEVLSNYFKDKEMQLQKELGVQEAVRQQKEEDASFATRRVNLIEEENSSYKYQVATLKQEIEETERNYKNQVALQEKKAHENWLAARAAERKLEEGKQESAQLRQRLTLLEREQENWLNSSRDEIVRPVPKRPGGPNGEIGSQEINRSKDSSSGSLPLPHEMIPPLRPPVLPLDRPLPPVRMPMMEPRFPHPLDPYFDFGPPLPFPPQPWHARGPPPDPLHPLDRRTPSYERGRLTPPPRRHQSPTVSDREIGRRSASPKEISSIGSHTSSPPHPLPHFHDIPPPPGSYDFRHGPHPSLNSRYPLPPPPRREFLNQGSALTRTDSRNSDMITSTPRGTHQLPPAQDRRHQQPSSRV